MNQEGTVMLQMLITDEGKVGQVRLQASSGWPRLDDAAMNASRDWEFIPGQWEGKATCMWVSMPIVYKLSDYTDAALSAVTVSPESQSISQFILGDKVLQEMVSQSSVKQKESSTEEQVAGQLAAVLSTRQEWHKALHDVAAMLTIELSAAEIEELNTLMKTPVLQKYYGLQNKLQPEIVRRQQYFGAVAYCVTGIMRQAAGVSDLEELSSNTLPAAMVPATPRIAKELEPYCDCMAERLTTTRNPNLARQICGAPPKITW
jgi:TonB family protein